MAEEDDLWLPTWREVPGCAVGRQWELSLRQTDRGYWGLVTYYAATKIWMFEFEGSHFSVAKDQPTEGDVKLEDGLEILSTWVEMGLEELAEQTRLSNYSLKILRSRPPRIMPVKIEG